MLRILASLLLLCSFTAQAAPVELGFHTLDGKKIQISDYRGKWVVINYWATWCPPCLEEIPELVHFHEKHKERDAVVIGIDMEDLDRVALQEFVEDNFITYPIVPLVKKMPLLGNPTHFPTTYLIDRKGSVAAKHVGAIRAEDIENFIAKQDLARTDKTVR